MSSSPRRVLLGTLCWNFAGFGFGLVNSVLIARLLLPEARGVFAIVFTASGLLALVSAVGVNVSYRVHQPRGDVGLHHYVRLSGKLSVLMLILTLVFIFVYGAFADEQLLQPALIAASLWLGITVFLGNQLFDAFNAVGRTHSAAMLNTLGILLVLMQLLFSSGQELSVISIVIMHASAFTLRILVGLWFGVVLVRSASGKQGSVRAAEWLLLRDGLRLMGMNIGQVVTYRADQLFLGALGDSRSVGIYAVAATPASIPGVISNSIGQIVFRGAAAGQLSFRQTLTWSAVATTQTALYALVFWLVAPWAIPWLFGPEYDGAVEVARILVIAEIALVPFLILSRAAAGWKFISIAGLSGAVGVVAISIALVMLIPPFGAPGAAYASMIAYAAMSVFALIAIVVMRVRRDRTREGYQL
ncbi:oligosaccharide flippase family protein [Microbacterium sp.]|uniref:oligosaccharide flippase family protein n=1 Tax=Microbacterium sp. TaxID=51671 RepID=UPI0028A6896C|nr:oligosaccharide flippase family protein [Microbacterium sp.]